MLTDVDIDDLAGFFMMKEYKWKIDGQQVVPTRRDLIKMIENIVEQIRGAEEDSISIECGNLLIKRSGNFIDLYCHVAELEFEE